MRELVEIVFDKEAVFELPGEAFRMYVWMKMYLPSFGYEISQRELVENLQISLNTVGKYLNMLIVKGYIAKEVEVGMTATYRVVK